MWETLDLCIKVVDAGSLDQLVPRLGQLVRSGVGLNTRYLILPFNVAQHKEQMIGNIYDLSLLQSVFHVFSFLQIKYRITRGSFFSLSFFVLADKKRT